MVIAGAAVAVVLVAIGTLIVVRVAGHHTATPPAAVSSKAPDQVTTALTDVPATVLDTVGTGTVATLPKVVTGEAVRTDNGKPLILYVGAEYCPFCAAQRWAAVVALSRFGTFTGLGVTHSATADVYPNTATVTFHGATYTSDYLTFQGVETATNQPAGNSYGQLDAPTAAQRDLLTKFDAPPYVSADAAGSIPFVDFANQAVISGASYSPQLLAGKTAAQIAAVLSDPTSPITKAIAGTANAFTTVLCHLTKEQPPTVCTGAAATGYQGKLYGPG
ncbi:MAG: hypothetical protein QOE03_784 [Micromonosporaceae bacterium]|jgi:hypothetical protein|nr:hypothetical protein [Micromonosporaceae bacterium]